MVDNTLRRYARFSESPQKMTLKKCLIANRGEIALRIIRTCREMGIQTVAVYSDADFNMPYVQQSDQAYHIGEPAPAQSYLNIPKLIDVALQSGCDCVHPAYGFLSENADFAQAVMDAGLVWVGPSPDTIRKMGVKTTARALMAEAGVPLVPGYQSDHANVDQFIQAADEIGYPVMVKAAGGGGGKGIRIVYDRDALPDALESARREADKAFGDARVFLERYIAQGNIVHLFERECSAQRRQQKIIEESPSPLLTPETRQAITQSAVKAAEAVGYVNAGTVEFIATPDQEFFFLEMNTRLQVEHPVTEFITGLDLVRLQFKIAGGGKLPFTQADIQQSGHAIECRLYAEDATQNFLPMTGRLSQFIPPHLPNVRIDAGVVSGSEITIHYDPMIAKIIVYAPNREQAIAKMKQALKQTVVLGTITNRDFLLSLLEDQAMVSGAIHTGYIDANLDHLLPESGQPIPLEALIALAYVDQTAQPVSTLSVDSGGDPFSAWGVMDNFRMGKG
jgi:3-methylcrotonyl-CoA carboxylase alpha subunit